MIPVAGVVVPLAGQQVVVTHGHTVFLSKQIEGVTRAQRRIQRAGLTRGFDSTHRSAHVVGLVGVPVGVEHRADPVAPGVLVLQEDVGQADPRREPQVPQVTGHKVLKRRILKF